MSKASAQPTMANTLRPVIVLVCICVVAGALLGAVQAVTAPVAQANAERKAQQTYASLVSTAASFEDVWGEGQEIPVAGCTAALAARDAAGEVVAYVIVAQSKGYGGQVPIAVAFSTEGKVLAATAMPNDETPGLGTRIADASYIGQYAGRDAQPVGDGDIDLISGATISSKAARSAFNIAVEAYEEVR